MERGKLRALNARVFPLGRNGELFGFRNRHDRLTATINFSVQAGKDAYCILRTSMSRVAAGVVVCHAFANPEVELVSFSCLGADCPSNQECP